MAIRDWFAKKATVQTVNTLTATEFSAGPLPPNNDYAALAEDGYRRNVIVYSCISSIALSCCEPPIVATDLVDGQRQPLDATHPLSALLSRPNAEQDWAAFLNQFIVTRYIAGEVFAQKLRTRGGTVGALWLLRPDRISLVADARGLVSEYVYKVGGREIGRIPAEDMIHLRNGDPLDDYRGLSEITVAARCGDLDNSATDFVRALFQNGGIPRGFLKHKQRIESRDEMQRIQTQFDSSFQGARGWNRTKVLDGDWTWERGGLDPREADMSSIFGATEARICAVFGVPPIIAGTSIGLDASTYSNYAQARRAFWEDTLIPLLRRIEAALTFHVAAEFSPSYQIAFDLQNVRALQDDSAAKQAQAVAAWQAGLVTRNEARMQMGLPRLVDGDVMREDVNALNEPATIEPQPVQQKRPAPRLVA